MERPSTSPGNPRLKPYWPRILKIPCTHLPELFARVQEAPRHTSTGPLSREAAGLWWLRLIRGVLGTGKDFTVDAPKRGCRALRRGWVGMATSPGPGGRGSQTTNGEVPS